MNKHREAEKNIKLLAGMVKGLIALVPDLERLGGFDKMIEEAQARLDAANAEAAQIEQTIARAAATSATIIGQANEESSRIIADAEEEARKAKALRETCDGIVANAHALASDIVEAGKRAAEQLVLDAQRTVDELNRAAADVETTLKLKTDVVSELESRRAALEVRLAEIAAFAKA